jgi:GNAT superfamily N-acetyltransferase
VWLRSRAASVPAIPAPVHTEVDVRAWFEEVVVPAKEVWVAEESGAVVALLVLDDEWIDQLYVEPDHAGRGFGGQLLEVAKQQRPAGLKLWTFEANVRARRFYERRGFVATGATAGDNEEGAPDIRYEWRPLRRASARAAVVPELDVSDLSTSVAFYGLLGFRVMYERREDGFVYLARDGAELMLQTAHGPGRRFRTAALERPFGRGVNLQLGVDDVDTIYASVLAAGHRPLVELEEHWYRVEGSEVGNRQFVVADPDGYLIRPFQNLGTR